MAKIGIYGGTFDPIHKGHLHVINEILSRGLADKILIIPAGQPWLRESAPIASAVDRRAMCVAALADLAPERVKQVEVNPIEILREGPSYTIDTVEAVLKSFPEDQISVIVGTDAYFKIDQWHRAAELKDMVDFIVIDRPNFPGEPNLDIGALNISATSVREGDISSVSPQVAAYIREHNLYASK